MDVFLRLLFEHVGNIVKGDHSNEAIIGVDHRSGDPVVTLEEARDFLLILRRNDTRALFFHQVENRHGSLAAQQAIKRYGALKMPPSSTTYSS